MALLLVFLTMAACASAPEATLEVAPIGRHDVPVGSTLRIALIAVGAEGDVHFELVAGPPAMRIVTLDQEATLTWQPNVFDLEPSPPGRARAPGGERRVEVRATDALGRTSLGRGVVRAVPAR